MNLGMVVDAFCAAAEHGLEAEVREMLATGIVDVNARGAGGVTPLHAAARGGHLATVQALLHLGAEVDSTAFDREVEAREARAKAAAERKQGVPVALQAQAFPAINIAPFVEPELFSDEARVGSAQAWDETFRRIGFAVIEGHGVSLDLIKELRVAGRRFFARGKAYKQNFFRGMQLTGRSGYSPIGIAVDHSDPVEGYTFMRHISEGWATSERHPSELVDAGTRYAYEMERVMHALHRMSAMALGLDPSYFDSFYTSPASVMVLSHYPPLGTLDLPDGKLRYRAHSDYSGFTVLLQDDDDFGSGEAGGLEIDIGGSWVPVRPQRGCFVVNIGDLFETWTNDRWRSTPHRVRSPPLASPAAARSRFTTMLFSGPALDSVIRPIRTCVSKRNPARYAPIKAADHLRDQYKTKSKEADYEPG